MEYKLQDREPSDSDVRRFVEDRLSFRNNGWNPEIEPLLMLSVEVVDYYLAKTHKSGTSQVETSNNKSV